jgi:pimeloyl-ACP methyl ester carboxylesterase
MKKLILPTLLALISASSIFAQKTITFLSGDGVTITADEYFVNDSLPWMLLCHQASFSRGEYQQTAKKFNKLGYNCMAVDLRSGFECNNVKNNTAEDADKKNKPTEYLDAEQDIVAAIDYLFERGKSKKIVLVGSSYSASLVLKLAVDNEKVSKVLAFSPGEYFGKKLTLKTSITDLNIPVYVACSAKEREKVGDLVKDVVSTKKTIYAPSEGGEHGSKALWKTNPNATDYWMSIMMFLK